MYDFHCTRSSIYDLFRNLTQFLSHLVTSPYQIPGRWRRRRKNLNFFWALPKQPLYNLYIRFAYFRHSSPYLFFQFQPLNLFLVVVNHGSILKIRDLIHLVLHWFKQEDGRFPILGYKPPAIALDVPFIEAVTRPALGVTIPLTKSGCHMLAVDIMAAISLVERKNPVTGYTSKCTILTRIP